MTMSRPRSNVRSVVMRTELRRPLGAIALLLSTRMTALPAKLVNATLAESLLGT